MFLKNLFSYFSSYAVHFLLLIFYLSRNRFTVFPFFLFLFLFSSLFLKAQENLGEPILSNEELILPPEEPDYFPMPADEQVPIEEINPPSKDPIDMQKDLPIIKKEPLNVKNSVVEFSGLDKITGRIVNFDVYMNETFQFGSLQVTPRVCYSHPDSEKKNSVFVEIDSVTLEKKIKRIFTGWIFAESPDLSALEDPVYDVWLRICKKKTSIPSPKILDAIPIHLFVEPIDLSPKKKS